MTKFYSGHCLFVGKVYVAQMKISIRKGVNRKTFVSFILNILGLLNYFIFSKNDFNSFNLLEPKFQYPFWAPIPKLFTISGMAAK